MFLTSCRHGAHAHKNDPPAEPGWRRIHSTADDELCSAFTSEAHHQWSSRVARSAWRQVHVALAMHHAFRPPPTLCDISR